MDLSSWLNEFRGLHADAKRGALTGQSLADYYLARDALARALIAAQHLSIETGQQPRRALRVSHALQADIAFFDGTLRVLTRSISSGGFAALLARPPKHDEEVKVSLRIPGGEPLQARAWWRSSRRLATPKSGSGGWASPKRRPSAWKCSCSTRFWSSSGLRESDSSASPRSAAGGGRQGPRPRPDARVAIRAPWTRSSCSKPSWPERDLSRRLTRWRRG